MVRVQLPQGVHVYAPGVQDYIPISFSLDSSPFFESASVSYPHPKTIFFPVIQERVPAFEGRFLVSRDITVNSSRQFSDALPKNGKRISVSGKLRYQACDTETCYLPVTVPFKWYVRVLPLDRQLAPESFRHR